MKICWIFVLFASVLGLMSCGFIKDSRKGNNLEIIIQGQRYLVPVTDDPYFTRKNSIISEAIIRPKPPKTPVGMAIHHYPYNLDLQKNIKLLHFLGT